MTSIAAITSSEPKTSVFLSTVSQTGTDGDDHKIIRFFSIQFCAAASLSPRCTAMLTAGWLMSNLSPTAVAV